jgi:hypothetical protein
MIRICQADRSVSHSPTLVQTPSSQQMPNCILRRDRGTRSGLMLLQGILMGNNWQLKMLCNFSKTGILSFALVALASLAPPRNRFDAPFRPVTRGPQALFCLKFPIAEVPGHPIHAQPTGAARKTGDVGLEQLHTLQELRFLTLDC